MKIPILMYHSVTNDESSVSISLNRFEKQMHYMHKSGYKSVNLSDLMASKNEKAFIITFDDGYEDVFLNAFPILNKFNSKATCFIVSNYIGKYNYWDEKNSNYKKIKLMNRDQILQLLNNDYEIGANSFNHKNLTKLDYKNKEIQIIEPKNFFKKEFQIEVKSFSYPYGYFDDETTQIVSNNYDFAVTTNRSRYVYNKFDNLKLPRIPINQKDSIFKFYLKIKTIYEDIKFKN